MRPDVADFYSGVSFDAYRLLGAHPAGRGWGFTVWAPRAQRVQALGDWNGWNLYTAAELCRCEDGLWRGTAPAAREGQLYKYNLLGADGVWHLRADPFAFACEGLPGTASRLAAPRYDFRAPPRRGARRGELMLIYELHASSWRRHWDGRYYTGPELAEYLIPYLLENHYTHAEFLPLAEYPFDGSWGYQGCGYFSPTQRLGGFAGFAALADALHAAGIGVIMDFVPVHFAPDAGFLANFDGAPLFESGPSEWGSLRFDLSGGPVRSFLLSAAAFWLHVAGCDGLRVDAIGSALSHGSGGWAAEFFKTLTAGLHARFPGAVLTAEDSAAGLNATAPTADGGLGFDYVWDGAWARDTLDYFSAPFAARPALFDRWAGTVGRFAHANGINAFSHDEAAAASLYTRMFGDGGQKMAQLRLLLLAQAARPGKSLLFAGGEFGQRDAFTDGREPNWGLLADGDHRALADYAAALNAFAAAHPALFAAEYDPAAFAWAEWDAGRGCWALCAAQAAKPCCSPGTPATPTPPMFPSRRAAGGGPCRCSPPGCRTAASAPYTTARPIWSCRPCAAGCGRWNSVFPDVGKILQNPGNVV